MAVNALGQNIQLLFSPAAPGADPSLTLKAGDLLQGRIVDLLPDNKAVISLRGLNLLAQLPEAQPGQAFVRGTLLDLAVIQAKPQGSAAQASLTLKLTGFSRPAQAAAVLPPSSPPLPRQTLEGLLSQANLPATSANLQAAQTLSRYGLPLDPQTLQSVMGAAQSMLQVEAPAQPQAPRQAQLPQPLREALGEARALLTLLSSQPQPTASPAQLQALGRQVTALLEGPQPSFTAQLAPPPQAKSGDLAVQLRSALNEVSAGQSQGLAALAKALNAVAQAAPALVAAPQLSQEPRAPQTPAAPALQAALPEVQVAFRREAAAALAAALGPMWDSGSVGQPELRQALSQMLAQASLPDSPLTRSVSQSVASQLPPGGQPADARPLLRQALMDIQSAFHAKPLSSPLARPQALPQALESRGLPSPGLPLSSLPQESVLEAVAFLKARDLPATRPAVEAVAQELGQGRSLAGRLESLLNADRGLPQGFLELKPDLARALSELRRFVSETAVRPEAGETWVQIRDSVRQLGLDLERQLLNPGPASDPANTLKAKLMGVREAARQAMSDPAAQASRPLQAGLESVAAEAQGAVNSLSTMQMAARPTPAFDVTTLQLPVMFNGQLQSGQLSVYWKRGRPHELSQADPVNVVFLLNTRGLGEVKVQLQVWKDECQCRVTLGNEGLRDFVKGEAGALEQGFQANTRFKLSSLDVASAGQALGGAVQAALGLAEDALAAPPAGGISLSA